MKKTIFILFLMVAIAIIIGVYFIYNKENNENKENESDSNFYSEIYSNYNDVDAGVDALMNSKEYKMMNEDEQIKIMEQFLKLYESAGIIRDLYYESSNKLYSFTYSSGELDGALGGVRLKEFEPVFN